MSPPACDETRSVAAELALGVLDGEERARVLAHVRGCPACRAHLDELAIVAQEILTAAPVHEPPSGFDRRVLDALVPARPPARRRWWLVPAITTAALLASVGATWITLSTTSDERRLGAQYREVLARAGGKYLSAVELRDAAGAKRGVVFAYQGDQPWVTIVLAGTGAGQPWRVGISTRTGTVRELGSFDSAATPVWGHALPLSVRELAGVHLTGADGRELRAQLRSR